jgi:hypothetical protein
MAVSRREWGAIPNDLTPDPVKTDISIHHLVTQNVVLGPRSEMVLMRQIDAQHESQGWDGIGYSIVVMLSGRSYVGRGMARTAAVENHNTGMYAIAFQGSFHLNFEPPVEQRREARRIIRSVLEREPTVRRLGGHGEYMGTVCPGRQLLDYMPKWRRDFGLRKP